MKRYNFNGEIITLPYTFEKDGETITTSSEQFIYDNGGSDYVAPDLPDHDSLNRARQSKLFSINAYDSSDAVNSFLFNGQPMWIDKATRVGLVNAANAYKALEHVVITVGIGGLSVTLPPDMLISFLYQIEMYALACYNVTLRHTNEVSELLTLADIERYDITEGYPEKISLTYEPSL